MEIETMADLKAALNLVPDEILKTFVVGLFEDAEIELQSGEGETEEERCSNWNKHMKEYPELAKINEYIRAIQYEIEYQEDTDGKPISTKQKE